MANYAKYSRSAMGHLTKHYERAKDDKGEYVRFGNQNIDTSRSHLNYNLAPHRVMSQMDFIHERLDEVYCMKRDDVVTMASCVVTVPKDVPKEYEAEFFERAYRFLAEKHGEKNVISAYVHNDETTPHMHFSFIPIVYDAKKDREKVCCKEVLTKSYLNGFHDELQKEMDRWTAEYGCVFGCNVLNGATENGNLHVQGLQARSLKEMNDRAEKHLMTVFDKQEAVLKDIDELKEYGTELKSYIKALENRADSLEKRLENIVLDKSTLERKFLEQPLIQEMFSKYQQEVEQNVENFKASKNPFKRRNRDMER